MITPFDHPSYDVFLAHGNGDCEAVRNLAACLADADVRTLCPEGHLPADARRTAELTEAVDLCMCIAFCLGSATLGRLHRDVEMQVALARASTSRNAFRLVAVLLPGARAEEMAGLPEVHSSVDFRAGLDDQGAFARLVAEVTRPRIRRITQFRRVVAPPPAPVRAPLRVFLCHSSCDKGAVRTLYHDLRTVGHQPWLDEEDLLPGQAWEPEIAAAIRRSDVVLACLSAGWVARPGFVQKELRLALDVAEEQPEGTIFLVPVRLDECEVPAQLGHLHWVNLFEPNGMAKLRRALDARARTIADRASSRHHLTPAPFARKPGAPPGRRDEGLASFQIWIRGLPTAAEHRAPGPGFSGAGSAG